MLTKKIGESKTPRLLKLKANEAGIWEHECNNGELKALTRNNEVVNAYVLKDKGESILLVLTQKLILYSKDLVELKEMNIFELLNQKFVGAAKCHFSVSRSGFSEQISDNNIYFWAAIIGQGIEKFKTAGHISKVHYIGSGEPDLFSWVVKLRYNPED